MLRRFYPDSRAKTTYDIDFAALYDEGFRGIIFDIDNTLVEHDAPADDRAKALFARLKELGFQTALVSNNKEGRVASFNKDIGAVMVWKADKPARRGYEEAMRRMGTDKTNTISVGDQLFTDIWGAKRTGIRTILVGQLARHEEIQIVLKRILERVVLHFYEKDLRRQAKKEKR